MVPVSRLFYCVRPAQRNRFYQNLDRTAVLTSTAQVFNERGDGVNIRGGAVPLSGCRDTKTSNLQNSLLRELVRRDEILLGSDR